MPELPEGYREVSEEDRKKAQVFFGHGDAKAATGQFDYAISMFLDGLRLDPDAVDAHRKLRDISLKRKASGGKALGMLEAMKLKKNSKDDKENLHNAERLLSFDPGNADYMLSIAQAARKTGYYDTVLWIGAILLEAEASNPKPDINKILALKTVYVEIKQYKLASDAMQIARRLKPQDMDLAQEAKDLAAQTTMMLGNYDKQGSFRDSVRDMKSQISLLNQDKEVNDRDILAEQVIEAERDLAAAPNEPGKLNKLVDKLLQTELPVNEDRAIKLLQEWSDRTKMYRFRMAIGKVRIKQMRREERAKVVTRDASPESKQEHDELLKKLHEYELAEFTEWAKAYPTDMAIRFDIGKRQLVLRQYEEAISSFQTARNDPKYRTDAQIFLCEAFFQADFLDEADETLATMIKDFPNRESPKFKDMTYLRGRVLEKKGATLEAYKLYSQVFQMDSGYKDVFARMKRLRPASGGSGGANAAAQ